eukprot:9822761-Karenia_brevis.AAC.1
MSSRSIIMRPVPSFASTICVASFETLRDAQLRDVYSLHYCIHVQACGILTTMGVRVWQYVSWPSAISVCAPDARLHYKPCDFHVNSLCDSEPGDCHDLADFRRSKLSKATLLKQ